MSEYFNNLKITLNGVPATNIINFDETNFSDDPGQVKVVVKRGARHPERIVDTSKTNISVMMAAAADGTILPPYTVYKAKHLYDTWTEGGINGAGYNRNQSGWFDLAMFESWFNEILLPYAKKLDGLKVLICDNLSSHLSLNVIKLCQEHEILFVLLPPNSTHLCQPLDVAFFRPLKAAWRRVLDEWKIHNKGVIQKSAFPRLLKETFEKIGTSSKSNVISGFRKAGIVPFCPDEVISLIPDEEDDSRSEETSWAASFEQKLKQARCDKTSATSLRAKRLSLTPGKGIVARDFDKNEIGNENSISSDRNEEELDTCEDEEMKLKGNKKPGDELNVNDFAVVKFPTKKRIRFFIGRIDSVEDDTYDMTFLRKKIADDSIYFVYPDNEDAVEVEKTQIIRKVVPVHGRRDKFIFNCINDYDIE